METKNFSFKADNFSESEEYYEFEGYASTFGNVDLGDDVVVRGAFLKTIASELPVMLWQHKADEPVGVFTECKEDENGLYVKGIMPKGIEFTKKAYQLLKCGAIKALSIGYQVVDSEIRGEIRYLKELSLREVSLVTFPMNQMARIVTVKSGLPYHDLPLADKDTEWNAADALARVKEKTGSIDEPSESYKSAFLYCEKEKTDDFESYKIQIADVVDGELVAVPRAISAASAVIRGAKGGLNITDEDRTVIEANINKYYSKMGEESPLKKGFSGTIDGLKSERELESFLKDWGFSQSERKSLVSALKGNRDDVPVKSRDDSWGEMSKQLAELNNILQKVK